MNILSLIGWRCKHRGDAVEVWKKMEVDRHIAVDAGLDDIAELEYFEEEWVRVGGGETGHK